VILALVISCDWDAVGKAARQHFLRHRFELWSGRFFYKVFGVTFGRCEKPERLSQSGDSAEFSAIDHSLSVLKDGALRKAGELNSRNSFHQVFVIYLNDYFPVGDTFDTVPNSRAGHKNSADGQVMKCAENIVAIIEGIASELFHQGPISRVPSLNLALMPRPCAVEAHASCYEECSEDCTDATALRRGGSRLLLKFRR